MKKTTFILAALSLLMIACSTQNKHQDEVTRLQNSLNNIEIALVKIDSIDSKTMDNMLSHYSTLKDEVWSYYSQDDTASYWRNELSDLQLCVKSMDRYAQETKGIHKELNKSQKQITALIHDLENDLVPEEKIEEYVATEIQIAEFSVKKAAKRGGRALYCYRNYDYIVEKADSLLTFIKAED
ncbi:MAG: hypothetical protein N4A46_13840 [Schleiferiaceae bacterium]|nr:hypothetical protein [Schleiferiaceae bacterium]